MKRIKQQGRDNVAKQFEAQRQGEDVRYPNGHKVRLDINQAENAVTHMKRNGGAPAVRPTFQMGAYFKTMPDGMKKLVREGEEGY